MRHYARVRERIRSWNRKSTWRRIAAIGLLLLAGLSVQPWTWTFWTFFAERWPISLGLAAGTVATMLLAADGIASYRAKSRAENFDSDDEKWISWLLSNRGMAAVVVLLAALGALAMATMLTVASAAKPDGAGNRNQLRIEAIKYGLGSVAAAGGLAALLLAVRRQRLAEAAHRLDERTQDHAEKDAAHRRITDLFTKAVEQLGHGNAAVRLGALYALKRVADEDDREQQTVADVLCAYLRMPYSLPRSHKYSKDVVSALPELSSRLPVRPSEDEVDREARQELQVRLALQRILQGRLMWPSGDPRPAGYWEGIDLDLTGAVLIDFALHSSRFRTLRASGAVFVGMTYLNDLQLDGSAFIDDGIFFGDLIAQKVQIQQFALFTKAAFVKRLELRGTRLPGVTSFGEAVFGGTVRFDPTSPVATGAFERARVILPRNGEDTWPPGFRVEVDPQEQKRGKLVYEDAELATPDGDH
jgi:hypothetical protein